MFLLFIQTQLSSVQVFCTHTRTKLKLLNIFDDGFVFFEEYLYFSSFCSSNERRLGNEPPLQNRSQRPIWLESTMKQTKTTMDRHRVDWKRIHRGNNKAKGFNGVEHKNVSFVNANIVVSTKISSVNYRYKWEKCTSTTLLLQEFDRGDLLSITIILFRSIFFHRLATMLRHLSDNCPSNAKWINQHWLRRNGPF